MKRLVKDSQNKKLCGVCSGIANYFECDPTIIRLLWAGSVIFLGVGLFAYVAALILPNE